MHNENWLNPWSRPQQTPMPCCPDCGQPNGQPSYLPPCTCSPLMIAVPPGQHIHIQCPRHGNVRIDGPNVTW